MSDKIQDAYETRWSMPAHTTRCGDRYSATEYGAWSAHDYATRFEGFRAGWQSALAAQASATPEPAAWQVRNGVMTHGFYRSEAEAVEVAFGMQKAHNLGGSLASFNVRPVYAAPPAAEQPNHVERNLNMAKQPDTVPVPRELLERLVDVCADAGAWSSRKELVAMLGKEGEA